MNEQADEPVGDGRVGSVADEAVRLFGALSDWAREAAGDHDDHATTRAAECTWCPVCRTVHAVREAGPEVGAHLAVAASSLLQAAAGVLAAAAPRDARRGAGGVEHIDLDDGTAGAWPQGDDE